MGRFSAKARRFQLQQLYIPILDDKYNGSQLQSASDLAGWCTNLPTIDRPAGDLTMGEAKDLAGIAGGATLAHLGKGGGKW